MSTLSPEQHKVVYSKSRDMVVKARAGAGKTHTLRAFAEKRPRARFLYIVFNKENAKEARDKFPDNVEAATSHSIAWTKGGMGKQFGAKMSGGLRPRDVAQEFRSQGMTMAQAKATIDVVSRFCSSAAKRVSDVSCDLGSNDLKTKIDAQRAMGMAASASLFRQLSVVEGKEKQMRKAVPNAARLWDRMCDPRSETRMTHDGYLKLYSMVGAPLGGYDCLLFDEAQDANPATIDILNRSPIGNRVSVGDDYQAIYGFRGSVNALAMLEARGGVESCTLTQTWRFGPEIAEAANTVLRACGEPAVLVGMGRQGHLMSAKEIMQKASSARGATAVLTRGNIAALLHALETPGLVHFAGGGSGQYRGELIEDVYRLRYREDVGAIRNPDVRFCESFDQLAQYAEDTQDVDLLSSIEFVEKTKTRTLEELTNIRKREVTDGRHADIILSTVHRSKGLEWDNVVLGDFKMSVDDFRDAATLAIRMGRPLPMDVQQEINLLYVGATRARVNFAPNRLLLGLNDVVAELNALRGAPHGQHSRTSLEGDRMQPVF